jgi:uncharacterized protein YbjT (DUF2867 family)
MARVLVTAALGNVGREVVRECAARGLEVRVAGTGVAALAERFPGKEAARLDFLDRGTWAPALAGCDQVFLLRPPPIGDMATTLCPFVDTAYAAGVRHLVFLSVAGADRMKWVPHRKVELHLMQSAGAWTVLRPSFFAQNLQDAYLRDIREDDRIYVPAGQGRVAFIDVRDVGAIAARVFEAPGEFRGQFLTLTGPEAVPFEAVAALLSAALGRPIRYEAASLVGYARHLASRGLPWKQILIQEILHAGLRRGDAATVDPTTERVLGQRPHTVAEYVREHAATWRR